MCRRKCAAFTLLETLVACALLLITTTTLGNLFIGFSRQAQRYENRQAILMTGEKAMMQIEGLLALTHAASVTIAGGVLSFPTCEPSTRPTVGFDGSGNPLWQCYDAFLLNTTISGLVETQTSYAPTTTAPTLSSLSLGSPTSWPQRTLATSISSFQVTQPVTGIFNITLQVVDSYGFRAQLASSVVAQN